MKALAYRIEGILCCCACAEGLVTRLPELFFSFNKPERVDSGNICRRCALRYGSHKSSCAAERIAAMIGGEK